MGGNTLRLRVQQGIKRRRPPYLVHRRFGASLSAFSVEFIVDELCDQHHREAVRNRAPDTRDRGLFRTVSRRPILVIQWTASSARL